MAFAKSNLWLSMRQAGSLENLFNCLELEYLMVEDGKIWWEQYLGLLLTPLIGSVISCTGQTRGAMCSSGCNLYLRPHCESSKDFFVALKIFITYQFIHE